MESCKYLMRPPLPPLLKPLFKRLGGAVGRNPLITLLVSIASVAVCASGMALLVSDTSYDLWYTSAVPVFCYKPGQHESQQHTEHVHVGSFL